jgi:hypothetical protein
MIEKFLKSLFVALALLCAPAGALQAAPYGAEASWTPTGDADVEVAILCDVNAAPTTARGAASDVAGKLAFGFEASGGEQLRCVSQGKRISTGQLGALSAEVSAPVPFPRPGQYPIEIKITGP